MIISPRPIGLCGRPGAGKNAAANVLSAIFGYRQASFAEALRVEVATIIMVPGHIRVPHEIICDPELDEVAYLLVQCRGMDPWEKPTPPKLRRLLQLYGTEFRRKQDPDYWVRKMELDNATAVTDVRFHNELKRIRAASGCVFWVHRTYLPEEITPHKSEELQPDVADRVIWNEGTLGELQEQVVEAMRSLRS